MEIYAAGGGSATTDPPAAMLNLRKRSAVDPRTGGPADGLILVSYLVYVSLYQLFFAQYNC